MTERQKRFAEKFIECGNASLAARLCGYSSTYAGKAMRQKGVREYLRNRFEGENEGLIATSDEVLELLTRVMRLEDKDDKTLALRLKAADMLMKRFAAGGERVEAAVIVEDICGDGKDL